MNHSTLMNLLALVSVISLIGCSGETEVVSASTPVDAEKPLPVADGASPGKPSAPISIEYEIVGSPIVGAPVLINVDVSSGAGPVSVQYNIIDTSALVFQRGQVQQWEISDPAAESTFQQLSVIPQREGRLYVNVSAEVMTPSGSMIRSMAIPIKVGEAPSPTTPNGEVVEGPDGEAVISLPAQEDTNPN